MVTTTLRDHLKDLVDKTVMKFEKTKDSETWKKEKEYIINEYTEKIADIFIKFLRT